MKGTDISRAALEETSKSRGFEVTDVRPGYVLGFAGGLLVFVVLCLAALAGIYRDRAGNGNGTPGGFETGATNLTSIESDWADIERETSARLQGYRWIDPTNGMVQIPIERAMRLVETGKEAP